MAPRERLFHGVLAGAASVTASTVPEAAPFASTARRGRCAQGAVNDHTQGTRATDVANRQTGIVLADRAGADEDGVVTGAHLVGEAQRVGAADPLGFTRRGRHAPVERLRVAHGDERPGRRLAADRRILFLSYHDAPFVGPPASRTLASPLEGRNMVLCPI